MRREDKHAHALSFQIETKLGQETTQKRGYTRYIHIKGILKSGNDENDQFSVSVQRSKPPRGDVKTPDKTHQILINAA